MSGRARSSSSRRYRRYVYVPSAQAVPFYPVERLVLHLEARAANGQPRGEK